MKRKTVTKIVRKGGDISHVMFHLNLVKIDFLRHYYLHCPLIKHGGMVSPQLSLKVFCSSTHSCVAISLAITDQKKKKKNTHTHKNS